MNMLVKAIVLLGIFTGLTLMLGLCFAVWKFVLFI